MREQSYSEWLISEGQPECEEPHFKFKPKKMKYYIVRKPGEGVTLYWDGLKFQQHERNAETYDHDEALQVIKDECLQYAELEAVSNVHPEIQTIINNHF